MPAEPFFIDDKLESLVRECIVFPADGSETHLAPMVARTLTVGDVLQRVAYSRCVDMASTYGEEHRKTQVTAHKCARDGIQSTYHFFYNLSPKLPINLNVARVIAVTPSHLKARKRLFWRGDVVAMKVQPKSEEIDFIVESLDANLLDLNYFEEFFRESYRKGDLDYLFHSYEYEWIYTADNPLLFSTYWDSAEMAEKALHDVNELRSVIGRPPLPRPFHMKSYTELAFALYAGIISALHLHQKVTGPPKLPLDLERCIFETCALESPEYCTVLVLVAKRVNEWIDPILIATVCIDESKPKREGLLGHFLAKLYNGKPFEYYARHIKNLSILAHTHTEETNNILAICTGVENLALWQDINFFGNPNSGRNLRRLTIKLERCFRSAPNFYHPCFAKLTHLHLGDDDDDWPTYPGWETLSNLTHLAFACSGSPEITTQLIRKLPAIRYVALGYYRWDESRKYIDAAVHNNSYFMDVRVVSLWEIPAYDWVRGARGEGDFWDLVEQEVERRLEKD